MPTTGLPEAEGGTKTGQTKRMTPDAPSFASIHDDSRTRMHKACSELSVLIPPSMLDRFRDQISERWAALCQASRKWLGAFLENETIRILLLRSVVLNAAWFIISSLLQLTPSRSSWVWVVVVVVNGGVMLPHHIYFVFVPTYSVAMEALDLVLASVELCLWFVSLQILEVQYLSQWSSVLQILNALSLFLFGISLILLLFARVCASLKRPAGGFRFLPVLHVFDNLYQDLSTPEEDPQTPEEDPPMPEESSTGARLVHHVPGNISRVPSSHARSSAELPCFSPSPPEDASTRSGVLNTKIGKVHWKAASKILLGRSAWVDPVTQSADYPGFRAFVYAVLVSGFLLFTALRTVIDPIREIGHPLLVETSFPSFISDDFTTDSAPLWNILAMINLDELDSSQINTSTALDNFPDAVNVTPLWDGNGPNCTSFSVEQKGVVGSGAAQGAARCAYIRISCPDRAEMGDKLTASMAVDDPSWNIWPDLLVTVNFTTLGMDSTSLGDNRARTVSITVALTDQIDDIILDSTPIPLIPNLYLLATVTTEFRERYKWTTAATLGILTFTKVHFTTSISLLVPDPSPLIPRIDNTATLRLYMGTDLSEWNMFSDGRQNSVLSGLIALGGLWTPVNGAITVIFGMSMLMLWWGKKPFSIFGLIHRKNKSKVVAKIKERYPGLENDVPGWSAFLRDFLIDMALVSSSNVSSNNERTHLRSTESSTISLPPSRDHEDRNPSVISKINLPFDSTTPVEMDDLAGTFESTSSSTISPAPLDDEDHSSSIISDITPLLPDTTSDGQSSGKF
ncbi:hypothetical protein MVEN_01418900 [Mycena venus]|uniref:Transmembrane protein n=1 Tax=Mycena venus TaxID=2733690 RepID=A0A8H6XZ26_9AGAR|nr:hypothetical protein MVEN_01418900 [Mycena venus]